MATIVWAVAAAAGPATALAAAAALLPWAGRNASAVSNLWPWSSIVRAKQFAATPSDASSASHHCFASSTASAVDPDDDSPPLKAANVRFMAPSSRVCELVEKTNWRSSFALITSVCWQKLMKWVTSSVFFSVPTAVLSLAACSGVQQVPFGDPLADVPLWMTSASFASVCSSIFVSWAARAARGLRALVVVALAAAVAVARGSGSAAPSMPRFFAEGARAPSKQTETARCLPRRRRARGHGDPKPTGLAPIPAVSRGAVVGPARASLSV